MKVLLFEPQKPGRLVDVGYGWEHYRKLIDCRVVQALYPFEDERVVLWCDDEAKLEQRPFNRPLYGDDKEIYDIVCGPLFLTWEENEDFPEELVVEYLEKLPIYEFAMRNDGKRLYAINVEAKTYDYIDL